MRFDNKIVLVTGASSGIGYATVLQLAQEGADVAFTYCHNPRNVEKLQKEVETLGSRALCLKVDVTKDDEIIQLAEKVEGEFGPVDILINNAGGLIERMPFFEITKERWDEIMALNLWSVFFLSQKIGLKMKDRGKGVIVHNASVAGRFGGAPGAMAYSVSKGALITLTQSMGKELIPYGIRVNAIAPGVIDTPFHDRFTPPDIMKQLLTRIPIGRAGTSQEMAKGICFLASEDSSYLVGATLDANGGMWVV